MTEPDWVLFNGRTIESVEVNDFNELEVYFTDGSKATIGVNEDYWGEFYVNWQREGDQ